MSADLITSRLEGVKRTGRDRWLALCPAHPDRRPSLAIRALEDGRTLIHCHSRQCEVESIVGAIGLEMTDLFPPRDTRPGAGAAAEPRPFSVRDLISALHSELHVAWVLLADLAAGREATARDRKRAAKARDRCAALIEELRLAR